MALATRRALGVSQQRRTAGDPRPQPCNACAACSFSSSTSQMGSVAGLIGAQPGKARIAWPGRAIGQQELPTGCLVQGLIHRVPLTEGQELLGSQKTSLGPTARCLQDLGTECGRGSSGASSLALMCQKRTQVSDPLSMALAPLLDTPRGQVDKDNPTNRIGHNGDAAGGSGQAAVLIQQRDHISGLSGVAGGWFEQIEELDTIALSLASSSASLASSFLIRSSSFLICSSLCSIAYRRTFKSTVGCQLIALWPSPGRQRCKEFLLAAVDRRKRLPGGRHGRSSRTR